MTDSVPLPPPLEGGARLRRNGKQQSCEPCRIRKQSCTHQTPCQRCIRHNRNCVYVDAPMSKERKAAAGPLTPTPTTSAVPSPKAIVRPPTGSSFRKPSRQDNPLTLVAGTTIGYSRTPAPLSLGYVGSTGYSAILDEAKAHLGMNIWELQDAPSDQLPWGVRPDGSNPGRAFCKKILAWLPPHRTIDKVRRWMEQEWALTAYQAYSVDQWHASFWEAYGEALDEPRHEKALEAVIDELVANTRRPLPTTPATNAEWSASYMGRRSRWEIIGEIFIMLGFMAATAPYSDPLITELLPPEFRKMKKNYACSMLECADACVMLCDELDGSSNFQILALLAHCVTLQSVVIGDTSYDLWKRVGHVANAVTGLGLHRKLDNVERIAPLYVEQRARAFARAYTMITSLSVFTGRPPSLCRRYVSIGLPLDVPNSVVQEAGSVSDLLNHVREDGWNARGEVTPMTMKRVYLIIAYFRDEILEISLGSSQFYDVCERLRDLRYRIEDTRRGFPPLFSIDLDKNAFATRTAFELSCVGSTRLNLLHTEFLIEKIASEGGRDERRFLQVAQEMLKIVVIYWTERDRFPSHRDEIHWFISFAGVPAASALAITLFKQTMSRVPNTYSVQRADMIQDLSLFVACLDWVRPEDGNYVLCGRVRTLIRHILDRVLSPTLPQVPEQDFSFAGYNLNDFSIDTLPQYGIEFNGWLDGIDMAGMNEDWTTNMLQGPGRFS